jgi:murein DD-endopeptidase MepM/ murein hydrolase activator NlpD
MLKKRLYTFIVAGHAGGKVRRLTIPSAFLITVGACVLIGFVAIGAGTLSYGRMLLKVLDYDRRLLENDKLRSENHNFQVQTAQLGEKIDFLETLSRKLEIISGMKNSKAVGGVGGSSTNTMSQPRPVSSNPFGTIALYDQKVASLEDSYRALDNRITESVLWLAAQPSIMPVKGYITAGFGRRPDPFDPSLSESHPGIDISAHQGSRIVAPADGIVIFAGQRAGYGNMVVIDHKFGITTRYGHMQRIYVQVGQHIARNETLGYVGISGKSTGPHLHYEVWQRNIPVNPARFFPKTG